MNSGKLITFEGLDGCGKSTQLEKVHDWLTSCGYTVLKTREPGGTKIGRQIRSILLNPEHKELQPESELLLYLSDRIQHLQETIIPAKKAGKIVLCDRFHDSTVAYQGYGRGEDVAELRALINYATGSLWPDLTLWLDLPVEAGLARIAPARRNRLDAEAVAFHRRVRAGYARLAAAEPRRWLRFD
ncbi:MAG: dTMP kinase, partial [SAR324 cluster bacterium]